MATYNASKMLAGTQPAYLPSKGGVNVLTSISQTTALSTNDVINLLQLQANPADPVGFGPTIIGMLLDTDKLDTGGSPQITLDVGDSGATQRYFKAVTTAQAGGYATPNNSAVLGFQPFAGSFATYTTASLLNQTVFLTCHLQASTWANGTIRLLAEYTFDP